MSQFSGQTAKGPPVDPREIMTHTIMLVESRIKILVSFRYALQEFLVVSNQDQKQIDNATKNLASLKTEIKTAKEELSDAKDKIAHMRKEDLQKSLPEVIKKNASGFLRLEAVRKNAQSILDSQQAADAYNRFKAAGSLRIRRDDGVPLELITWYEEEENPEETAKVVLESRTVLWKSSREVTRRSVGAVKTAFTTSMGFLPSRDRYNNYYKDKLFSLAKPVLFEQGDERSYYTSEYDSPVENKSYYKLYRAQRWSEYTMSTVFENLYTVYEPNVDWESILKTASSYLPSLKKFEAVDRYMIKLGLAKLDKHGRPVVRSSALYKSIVSRTNKVVEINAKVVDVAVRVTLDVAAAVARNADFIAAYSRIIPLAFNTVFNGLTSGSLEEFKNALLGSQIASDMLTILSVCSVYRNFIYGTGFVKYLTTAGRQIASAYIPASVVSGTMLVGNVASTSTRVYMDDTIRSKEFTESISDLVFKVTASSMCSDLQSLQYLKLMGDAYQEYDPSAKARILTKIPFLLMEAGKIKAMSSGEVEIQAITEFGASVLPASEEGTSPTGKIGGEAPTSDLSTEPEERYFSFTEPYFIEPVVDFNDTRKWKLSWRYEFKQDSKRALTLDRVAVFTMRFSFLEPDEALVLGLDHRYYRIKISDEADVYVDLPSSIIEHRLIVHRATGLMPGNTFYCKFTDRANLKEFQPTEEQKFLLRSHFLSDYSHYGRPFDWHMENLDRLRDEYAQRLESASESERENLKLDMSKRLMQEVPILNDVIHAAIRLSAQRQIE